MMLEGELQHYWRFAKHKAPPGSAASRLPALGLIGPMPPRGAPPIPLAPIVQLRVMCPMAAQWPLSPDPGQTQQPVCIPPRSRAAAFTLHTACTTAEP